MRAILRAQGSDAKANDVAGNVERKTRVRLAGQNVERLNVATANDARSRSPLVTHAERLLFLEESPEAILSLG